MNVLNCNRCNLSEYDGNNRFTEHGQTESFAAKEEWEEFDWHNPHHGVEEECVAERIDKDERDRSARSRRVFGTSGKFGRQCHNDADHNTEEGRSNPYKIC